MLRPITIPSLTVMLLIVSAQQDASAAVTLSFADVPLRGFTKQLESKLCPSRSRAKRTGYNRYECSPARRTVKEMKTFVYLPIPFWTEDYNEKSTLWARVGYDDVQKAAIVTIGVKVFRENQEITTVAEDHWSHPAEQVAAARQRVNRLVDNLIRAGRQIEGVTP